jgi:hypothetical protein
MGCCGGKFKFEFRQMLKTTREHCKKLMQVSIDSEINNDANQISYRPIECKILNKILNL